MFDHDVFSEATQQQICARALSTAHPQLGGVPPHPDGGGDAGVVLPLGAIDLAPHLCVRDHAGSGALVPPALEDARACAVPLLESAPQLPQAALLELVRPDGTVYRVAEQLHAEFVAAGGIVAALHRLATRRDVRSRARATALCCGSLVSGRR